MEETVKTRRGPLGWVKKHKKLTVLLVVVIIAAVLVLRTVLGVKKAMGTTYQYVRTTTLQKTSLTDSVSVNGTVKSGTSASVTAAESVKTYKVTSVNVAVGDTVKKGDVIATLDTADVEKQIEKAELNYSDTLQSAQTSKDRAESDLEVSTVQHENNLIDLQSKITQADEGVQTAKDNLNKAYENQRAAQGAYDAAVSDYNDIKSGYDSATANISTFTAALNAAADERNQALAAYNAAGAPESGPEKDALDNANNKFQSANEAMENAKNECSVPSLGLYGYDAISKALTQAETEKDSAEKALNTAKDAATTSEQQVDTANQQVKTAHDSYDNEKNYSNLTNKAQNLEDSETKLEQAQRTPDDLDTLQKTLDNCTLTATMDGTVTALNATVGSVCSGTVATIQNTDDLVVEVTIPASSVPKLATGMACRITSDATGDTVVNGTLTRIDPVANDSGTFGATVTVGGQDSGLLIGISAKVEIVISEKDNVFTVPRDAVGTNDDGSTYVLRKTGGEGVDMTFEQVAVTEGDTNDYYVEITGSDLNEGDVIRSSADLTQGIETNDNADSGMQMMENGDIYVGDPGNMPEGGGDAPAGGPGGAPDGGPGGQ
ncbi:HlyD family efflux transporter periplasmic adaptor subunit [Gemmiger sp.]